MDYIAYLHKERNSDFGVSFPDFPGCVTAGKTLEEARRMAAEALAMHIEGLIEDGEQIPTPATLDALANKSQVEKIDARAKRFGLSRSASLIRLERSKSGIGGTLPS